MMEIEIVEFYPLNDYKCKYGNRLGYLHVYLIGADLDIAGVGVTKTKSGYFITMPQGCGTHHKTKEKIRFPIVRFCNPDRQDALIAVIKEQAGPFIENWAKEHPEAKALHRRLKTK